LAGPTITRRYRRYFSINRLGESVPMPYKSDCRTKPNYPRGYAERRARARGFASPPTTTTPRGLLRSLARSAGLDSGGGLNARIVSSRSHSGPHAAGFQTSGEPFGRDGNTITGAGGLLAAQTIQTSGSNGSFVDCRCSMAEWTAAST